MSRPREFDSAASKQAAYRARHAAKLVSVDRAALAGLHDRLERLQSAIVCAARRCDGFQAVALEPSAPGEAAHAALGTVGVTPVASQCSEALSGEITGDHDVAGLGRFLQRGSPV